MFNAKSNRDCMAARGPDPDLIACTYPKCTCGPKLNTEPGGITYVDQPLRLLSTLSSAERKQYPMATGLLDYFPDALALVSHISYRGNEKHNPGQPLHWSRGKSADHDDCVIRHMVERGGLDGDGVEHLAEAAWRALAALQEHLEKKHGLSLPRGAKAPE